MDRKKITIIENDHEILDVLKLILHKDYDVELFVAPPNNFLEQLKTNPPDVIILDWLIPNVHTEDLVSTIRMACEETVKLLIISAHPSVFTAFKDKPVDAILAKPFGAKEIRDLITSFFNQDQDSPQD